MKVLYFTNEYPPNIYGGAGVNIDYLSREMSKLCDVEVRCFKDPYIDSDLKIKAKTYPDFNCKSPQNLHSVFNSIYKCLNFSADDLNSNVVHCHTWYTHLAGIFVKLCYNIPLFITAHSLEPLRPWKREQLGQAYEYSSWVEKSAIEKADKVLAVSNEMKRDVLNLFSISNEKVPITYNGIDINEYKKNNNTEIFSKYNIDKSKPFVLFVGRITKQKGIAHLIRSIYSMNNDFQVVLCAGAADTKEIENEITKKINELIAFKENKYGKENHNIIWIKEMISNTDKIDLYSQALAFVCPSIYEPFGIINLEAMACETAVVANSVGGIKEVVVHEKSGYLIDTEQEKNAPFEIKDPIKFANEVAEKVNYLVTNPDIAKKMGKYGRSLAIEKFSWSVIAQQTYELYKRSLLQKS